MPYSSQSGKAHIKRIIDRTKPKTALDIGVGAGTYASLFPRITWDGIEIFEPYVERFQLREKYRQLHIMDAMHFTFTQRYDLIVLGDVLEHLPVEQAQALVRCCRTYADTVIVSIPIGPYPQGEFEGNPHEAHVTDDWSVESFDQTFGRTDWRMVDHEIGVFVWSRHDVRLRIAVYAIAKNEAQFVERFCASAADADCIVVADTGSTDDTAPRLRACGATVHTIAVHPWRFDVARNAALALVPADMDVCISLDLDEVLTPGWRQEIERLWTADTTMLWYLFAWGQGITFPYRKIHSRFGYRWHHPCHEDLRADPRLTPVEAHTGKVLVEHHPDPTKSRGQYMEILEAAVKEDASDPSHYFYYARELTFYQRWHEAIAALHTYLGMNAAVNQNERCYAMRLLGKSHTALGDQREAEKWFLQAAGEAPNTREPWCELALLMHHQHRWPECFAFSMRALSITEKHLVYTCDPAVWGHWAHDLASIAAWHLGLKDIAHEQARLAVAKSPHEARLVQNLAWFEQPTD